MLDTPPATPTRQLFEEFVEHLSRFASLEARLLRAELKETSSKLVSAAGLIAGAVILVLGAFFSLLAAAALFLVRLRVAPDLACLIVALIVVAIGAVLFFTARQILSKKLGVPRSLRQLSMLRAK
jgi:uncharacterized membrane protein YbhN (UPF0104 family)